MNPNEINKRIAEACGWKLIHKGLKTDGGIVRIYDNGEETARVVELGINELPKYANDLNAMAIAEGTLTTEQIADYFYELNDACGLVSPNSPAWILEYSVFTLANATAAQRAEAFLRTIGKWEDGE